MVVEAIQKILAAANKHGIVPGIHCGSTDYARKAIGWGFRLTTVMADNALLNQAAKAAVAAMRGDQAAPAKPSGPY